MKSTVYLFICLWMLGSSAAIASTLTEETRQDLFSQAKDYFRQANELRASSPQQAGELYQKALLRFERLVRDGGIENGKLYYNIGNTWFMMGQLGEAILNYRRALRYVPHDANLRQNLEYARSQRKDQFEEQAQEQVMKILLFWHYDFSLKTRFLVFMSFFGLFWLGLIVRLFQREWVPPWGLFLTSLTAILLLGSLMVSEWHDNQNPAGVITETEVIARKGDGQSYQPGFREPLHEGTEFSLLDSRNGWLHIQLPDGRESWIPEATAGLIHSMEPPVSNIE
ncbi:MAG: tetratricopeptide repeat protein [SAR324 cluster bacterium]|nr:tetratricopeptide repeat protein [SAR324 cluster bacterium]